MQHNLFSYFIVLILTFVSSCNNSLTKCEPVQEWKVEGYKIVKSKCPDLVQAHYYEYDIYIGQRKVGRASQVDSCIFTRQAEYERYFTFDVCEKTVQELKPNKISLDAKDVDSVTIFSRELNQQQLLNKNQIEKLAQDWASSIVRGYSNESFDSAFSNFPAYQYKLTVFAGDSRRHFYGYNYIILDESNWKYEMSKIGDLSYFNNYWKK